MLKIWKFKFSLQCNICQCSNISFGLRWYRSWNLLQQFHRENTIQWLLPLARALTPDALFLCPLWPCLGVIPQHPPQVSRATWSVFRLVGLTNPRNCSSDTALIKRALHHCQGWNNDKTGLRSCRSEGSRSHAG